MISNEQKEQLYKSAINARKRALSPYSGFSVGAAILTEKDVIYTGCNIESSSYGLSVCAERVALFNALSAGENNFKCILIISDSKETTSPCGACRQLLFDYAPNIDVIMTNLNKSENIINISELLKYPFKLNKKE